MRRRALTIALLAVSLLLVLAPLAFASDDGQGTYGPIDDKVTTNAGFLLIGFFPLFILVMSLLQWQLDKRKERRKAAHKRLAREERIWRGGW
jgi:hypothetical protein